MTYSDGLEIHRLLEELATADEETRRLAVEWNHLLYELEELGLVE